jgi:hypothetical protein
VVSLLDLFYLENEGDVFLRNVVDFQRTTRRYIREGRTVQNTAVGISNPTILALTSRREGEGEKCFDWFWKPVSHLGQCVRWGVHGRTHRRECKCTILWWEN